MRVGSTIGHGARHILSVGLQALIVAAILAIVSLMMSALYKPAGFVAGVDDADAARPRQGAITVDVPVRHGETTTATVNPGGEQVYVRVRCWVDGAMVYGRFFDVDSSDQADIGPLRSTDWESGGARCEAQEGYFTRNGLGKWVVVAETTFRVDP